ncbi:MAG: hypothetical protein HC769_00290 [Cyanobacteria bacterium CRU_2_1]|nr:hypothetical protein [Cyanobacteria bacterium CRU_2_1]
MSWMNVLLDGKFNETLKCDESRLLTLLAGVLESSKLLLRFQAFNCTCRSCIRLRKLAIMAIVAAA